MIPAEGELEEAAECEAHPRAASQRDKSLGVPTPNGTLSDHGQPTENVKKRTMRKARG